MATPQSSDTTRFAHTDGTHRRKPIRDGESASFTRSVTRDDQDNSTRSGRIRTHGTSHAVVHRRQTTSQDAATTSQQPGGNGSSGSPAQTPTTVAASAAGPDRRRPEVEAKGVATASDHRCQCEPAVAGGRSGSNRAAGKSAAAANSSVGDRSARRPRQPSAPPTAPRANGQGRDGRATDHSPLQPAAAETRSADAGQSAEPPNTNQSPAPGRSRATQFPRRQTTVGNMRRRDGRRRRFQASRQPRPRAGKPAAGRRAPRSASPANRRKPSQVLRCSPQRLPTNVASEPSRPARRARRRATSRPTVGTVRTERARPRSIALSSIRQR